MKSTRKLTGPFAAVAPFVFILAFGAKPESSISLPHSFPTYTQQQEENLEGYRDILIQSRALNSAVPLSPKEVRSLARNWIKSVESKDLKPLYPAFASEITEPGPRAEVINYWQELSSFQNVLALHDIQAHDIANATVDLKLLYELLDSFKYGGSVTILSADSCEGHSLDVLKNEFPNPKDPFIIKLLPTVKSIITCGNGYKTFLKVSDEENTKFASFESKVKLAAKDGKPLTGDQADENDIEEQDEVNSGQLRFVKKDEIALRKRVMDFGNWKNKPIASDNSDFHRILVVSANFKQRFTVSTRLQGRKPQNEMQSNCR